MKRKIFLGIDGGYSKTAMVLLDSDSQLLASIRGPGSAIVGPPLEESRAVLRDLTTRICEQAGIDLSMIDHCGIGMNGVDFKDEFEVQHQMLSETIGFSKENVTLVNDGIVALWRANDHEKSVVIQHGTGNTQAWRKHYGGELLFDGLNVGEIYDLRYELQKVVVRMIDGRLPVSPLKEEALKYFQTKEDEFAERIFRSQIPLIQVQRSTPVVVRAWKEGDPIAAMMIERAVNDYVTTACAMIRKVGEPVQVTLSGGVIEQLSEDILERVATAIQEKHPNSRFGTPLFAPGIGAAIMAACATGLDPREMYDKALQNKGIVLM